jgi:ribosome recycling factor
MFAEPIKKVLADAEERMKKSVQVTSQELTSLRTGASVAGNFRRDQSRVLRFGPMRSAS